MSQQHITEYFAEQWCSWDKKFLFFLFSFILRCIVCVTYLSDLLIFIFCIISGVYFTKWSGIQRKYKKSTTHHISAGFPWGYKVTAHAEPWGKHKLFPLLSALKRFWPIARPTLGYSHRSVNQCWNVYKGKEWAQLVHTQFLWTYFLLLDSNYLIPKRILDKCITMNALIQR